MVGLIVCGAKINSKLLPQFVTDCNGMLGITNIVCRYFLVVTPFTFNWVPSSSTCLFYMGIQAHLAIDSSSQFVFHLTFKGALFFSNKRLSTVTYNKFIFCLFFFGGGAGGWFTRAILLAMTLGFGFDCACLLSKYYYCRIIYLLVCTDFSSALWKTVYSFTNEHAQTLTPPPVVGDLAADFCLLSLALWVLSPFLAAVVFF